MGVVSKKEGIKKGGKGGGASQKGEREGVVPSKREKWGCLRAD